MKNKVLITDTAPLYPPLWGGPRRIWNLYSNLSQELFDITYVGVNVNLDKHCKYRVNKIHSHFKEILCAFPQHYYLWHAFENLVFKNTSLDLFVYLWMHTDWQFKYILNCQNADITICSHPWSSLCIDKKSSQFFIYDAHNCEYLLMYQILRRHPLRKFVLKQVKRIEQDACKKSDLILVCSEKQKNEFIDLYKVDAAKIIAIPNGTNIIEHNNAKAGQWYRKKFSLSPEEKIIVFIGAYYGPNIEAAKFIIERLAPELKEFKFIILGNVADAFKAGRIPVNVKLLGCVSDEHLDAVLRGSEIAINPMFKGSGINIKMLDYMAYGLPIVTTDCGARGIETDGKCPMIVSSFDKFADNIRILANDAVLSKRLSEDGKSLVFESYDWKQISHKLQDVILERLKVN